MHGVTYDVRVYKTSIYRGVTVTTYYVRWKVGTRVWKEPFRTAAQADGFRSELVTVARKGEAFSIETGRPASWDRKEQASESGPTWYDFARSYAAMKWPYASPNHRRGIAEALIDATEALTVPAPGGELPARGVLRRALREWTFSVQSRENGKAAAEAVEPPADIAPAVKWLEQNTVQLIELVSNNQGTILARRILDRISRKQDGTLAAANTANRKRMVLNNAMEYACEVGALPVNPLKRVKWTKQRMLRTVDPGVVINSSQARRFLAAVAAQEPWGPRLIAFFGCMYYAALRPEEAVDLRRDHLTSLPEQGWGEMRLTNSEPRSGTRWTDNGKSRERRPLKHRAEGDSRRVPVHPELVALLRTHLERFGTGRDNRLFTGPRGGVVAEWAYLEVFRKAREATLTSAEAASPLMGVPYDLRHAAVSTWLKATADPPRVAEWAGHSVDVLLRVYVKCIAGQQDEAKRRIEEAMKPPADPGDAQPDDDKPDK